MSLIRRVICIVFVLAAVAVLPFAFSSVANAKGYDPHTSGYIPDPHTSIDPNGGAGSQGAGPQGQVMQYDPDDYEALFGVNPANGASWMTDPAAAAGVTPPATGDSSVQTLLISGAAIGMAAAIALYLLSGRRSSKA